MRPHSATATGLLLLGSLLWVALVFAAPALRAGDHVAAPFLYALFDTICHQRPERSFHLWGEPLAACHRCLGLYLGLPLGALLVPRFERLRALLVERPRYLLLFFAPMALDVLIGHNVWASRFTTGLVASLPLGFLLVVAVSQLLTRAGRGEETAAATVPAPQLTTPHRGRS